MWNLFSVLCGLELKRCLLLSKNFSHVIKMIDQLIMTRLMLCSGTSADQIRLLLEGKLFFFFSYFFFLTNTCDISLFHFFFLSDRGGHMAEVLP